MPPFSFAGPRVRPPAAQAKTFTAPNYHDLVDMPFFVGRFDMDSTRISDTWVRLATYPIGSVSGDARTMAWDWLKKMIPPQVAVFKETPFRTYTVMQIADSSYAIRTSVRSVAGAPSTGSTSSSSDTLPRVSRSRARRRTPTRASRPSPAPFPAKRLFDRGTFVAAPLASRPPAEEKSLACATGHTRTAGGNRQTGRACRYVVRVRTGSGDYR